MALSAFPPGLMSPCLMRHPHRWQLARVAIQARELHCACYAVRVLFARYFSLRGLSKVLVLSEPNLVGIDCASFVSPNEMYPVLALRYDASVFFWLFSLSVSAKSLAWVGNELGSTVLDGCVADSIRLW
ncbi:hypothetical protein PMIN01_08445 [Paraphaeosphaeria minitans]|uniref:Uncharacterized protein n=1 Tax=Paraphaeosphaeria minitans TaxID=565426 RepID=A0A9P6GE61_9PLEO|nr:hypothetical protein PMIN01_08445 [Paraphaeosphaeria minitans]